jgi:hypothetical protein
MDKIFNTNKIRGGFEEELDEEALIGGPIGLNSDGTKNT